jgi:3-hydroxyisobutyrate dehydrogenase-like beta-hydroxyacid dehydrogenase
LKLSRAAQHNVGRWTSSRRDFWQATAHLGQIQLASQRLEYRNGNRHDYEVILPSTAVNTQLFNAMVAAGGGDLDNSAVIEVLEGLNNEVLETK